MKEKTIEGAGGVFVVLMACAPETCKCGRGLLLLLLVEIVVVALKSVHSRKKKRLAHGRD